MMNSKRRSTRFRALATLAFACVLSATRAQSPQHLVFAGLRTASGQGQFNAIQTDASGNLYLLLDQKDGIRLLKTDPTATNILARAQLGAQGDVGLVLALDPAGNPYVAGTTTSATLTGTQGAAFPTRTGASTNSFLARFDPSLNTVFLTFAGTGPLAVTGLAVTADAAFLTGSLFTATLPTTPNAFQQTPAQSSTQNGFVERFSSDGATLVYATYLTGASGDTAPAAIAVDSADNAYIAGYTTSLAYPTTAALIPTSNVPSGFLTKLTPAGDALTFSTYIPGDGISSLALDPAAQTLLLSGTISLSQFPIATVQTPLVNTPYQSLLRIPLDGSSVTSSTLLAPGTQSVVIPGPNSTAWAAGALTTPLLPIPPLSTIGTAFAAHINAQSTIDQTARVGGLPTANPNNSSAPITLTSLALDPAGQPYFAGSFTPTTSSNLLATEQYDLSLTDLQPPLLPSSVAETPQPPGSCQGSLCTGSAAYLAQLAATAAPSLALSIGASPNITLRNLGSVTATNLSFLTTGYTLDTNCPGSLPPGVECAVSLTGPGPGVLTANADNARAQTATLPATTLTPNPIVFFPHELDFGIQTATSAPVLRTLTISNLSSTPQPFTSTLDSASTTSPFSEASSDCPSPVLLINKLLDPDTTCHITFAFALNSSTPDGPTQANWTIAASGHHDVLFTGFAQSAALTPSAATIDFGTRYPSGPSTDRYLYISNNSDTPILHTPAAISSPFTLTDLCPATLLPHSVCQIQLIYASPTIPSNDATILALDQGISVLVTGQTLPQPGSGPGSPSNLTISPTALVFATAVPVTTTSSPQTVTITNTGSAPYPLTLDVNGDFTDTTACPAVLPAQAACTVNLTFAPTAPGTRGGLLTIASTSGTAPIYVGLTGAATSILESSDGTIPFGTLPITESVVQWLKITHSFQTLTAVTAAPYQAILVEDTGYGHGSPTPSAFSTNATGTCFNCFLGLRFSPATTGPQPGTLNLSFTGAPYTVSLTGTGSPLTGLIATPATQDFGPIPLNSTSQPILFALTNLTPNPLYLNPPTVTPGFALSPAPTGGLPCTGTLAPSSTCFANVAFAPIATGSTTGTLTFQSTSTITTVPLTGVGFPDPGLSINPTSLTFQNLPGSTATQQVITLTNTGASTLSIGTPITTTANFSATTTCAALVSAASCPVTVTFTPSSAPASATLQVPVTSSAGSSSYTIPLAGAYTSQSAGLQLLPAQIDFGPGPTGAVSGTRAITLNNLTAKTVSVALAIPAQFAITDGDPCLTLAPNASCTFNVAAIPLTTGDPTGTLFAVATPADGAAPSTTLAYLQSYGLAPSGSILAISGPLSPGTGVVDFGQLNSGQTTSKTLTLTNLSATQSITIRRLTSQPPFLSTTTCGQTLMPAQTCNVTLTYSPVNQVPIGTAAGPPSQDIGSLTIESDAFASPNIIPLPGRASPISSDSPSNTPVQSSYTLTQGSLTFFTTAVGDISPPQTITFTNTGNTTLHLGALTSTPEFPVTTTCTQPIAPASTCTLSLTFTPQTNGPRTAALEIATDSGISLDVLTLYGLASPPSLLLAPLSLDFGAVLIGVPSTQTVTLTNNGPVPVNFSTISITGDYAQTNTCPAPNAILPSGATCTIQVTFTPTLPGPSPGTLTLATSASTSPLTITLTGSGTSTSTPAQPRLQITPTTVQFGSVQVGVPSSQSLTVTNTGQVPVTFSTLSITGDYSQTTTCLTSSATLPSGSTCTIQITFTPTATGPRLGTLTLSTSAPTLTVPLSGTGIQSQLQITPNTLTFGSIPVGSSASLPITLANTGTAPLALTLATTGDYTSSPCPTTLAPTQTCTPNINFTPTAPGPRPGALLVNGTTIPLTGTGTSIPPPDTPTFTLTIDNSQSAIATVTQGAAATYALTATPLNNFTGPIALTCAPTVPTPYVNCAVAPPSLTLDASPQTATLTLTTLTRLNAAYLLPLLFLFAKKTRRTRAILATLTLLLLASCGGGPEPNLRYATPGAYTFTITAASTTGAPITQTVTATLIITAQPQP